MELDPCFFYLLVSVSPGSLYHHKALSLICGMGTIMFSSSVVFRIKFSAESKILHLVCGCQFLHSLFPFLTLKEAQGSEMPFQEHLPQTRSYFLKDYTHMSREAVC